MSKAVPYSMLRFAGTPEEVSEQWHANRRRDLDNVCFGKKFVCDGLVKAGVLIDDKPRYVVGFVDEFAYDEENPRIVVTLETA